ncbi:class E sortase [Amycolatopsis sp. cmx-11-12]|uniref:class E sortase n=1 Tax=Amycolatopsis sp. cmx-11-12 TaxID=2785795 RepID=UPI00391822BF
MFFVLGLVTLLFTAYQVWGRPGEITREQAELSRQLDQQWQAPVSKLTSPYPAQPSSVPLVPGVAGPAAPLVSARPSPRPEAPLTGRVFARLTLPRLGMTWTVAEGTDEAVLRNGLGHYSETQMPGIRGNFAVAGHRQRGLLWDLDQTRRGDAIVVETLHRWFVYRIDYIETVPPSDIGVLAPVPDHPGMTPGGASIVLQTCTPKWSDRYRLIVVGRLESEMDKTVGQPAALVGR